MSARDDLLARLARSAHDGPLVILRSTDPGEMAARCQVTVGHPAHLAWGSNTYEEALHSVGFARGGHLTFVTSKYHELRAFLTFVQALKTMGMQRAVKLWSWPAPSHARMEEEYAKIELYQGMGHVASYEDGIAHLAWREAQRDAA